jgi:hypothetical protein
MAPAVAGSKEVLMATVAKFDNAVFAPAAGMSLVNAKVPPLFGKLIARADSAVEVRVVALAPVPITKPEAAVEAVRIVPVIEFAVDIVPNPLAIDPLASAPTVVRLEVTTLEAKVVPEIFPAALTTLSASGKVITRVPLVDAPVILKLLVPGVPEVPAR